MKYDPGSEQENREFYRSECRNRKKRKGRKRALGTLALSCILLLCLCMNRTGFIIRFGIPAYRRFTWCVLFMIAACLMVITATVTWKRPVKKQPGPVHQDPNTDSGKITKETLHGRINNLKQKGYPEIYLQWCEKQMNQMDQYQERLSQLLKDNYLTGLQNIEDTMQELEDALYSDIQMFLNSLSILDTDKDAAEMKQKMKEMEEGNNARMRAAKELLTAVVDYANGSEKNQAALLKVETCVNAIYDTLKLLRP